MSKKRRYRLKDVEAKLLGKNLNAKFEGRTKALYSMSDKDIEKLRKLREDHTFFVDECAIQGIDPLTVSNYWHKGKHFSIHVKPNQVSPEEMRDTIIKQMNEHSPKYKKIKYKKENDPHLLVIDPADIHLGKLAKAFETGDDYSNKIAMERVMEGVRGIVRRAQGFPINQIMLVLGNDVLHIDTKNGTTTKGTPMDTDGMWYENFMLARKMYTDIIEILMMVAPVHCVYNPSNHDYMSSFFLTDSLNSWFRLNDSVTFDATINPRKYFRYGKSLIGTTHGDGAKWDKLPILMARESGQDWVDSDHKYFYVHHLHHKIAQDFFGISVEALRSPTGTDGWHHGMGFAHQPKAVEGFIHHPVHGQIARLTHLF